jgi:hypothetical protein
MSISERSALEGTDTHSVIRKILEDHPEGRWSDNTTSCRGCAERFLDDHENASEDMTDEQNRDVLRQYKRLSHPGWNHQQWAQHVTDAIMDQLRDA